MNYILFQFGGPVVPGLDFPLSSGLCSAREWSFGSLGGTGLSKRRKKNYLSIDGKLFKRNILYRVSIYE